MSLRTNQKDNKKSHQPPQNLEAVIAKILGKVGGSIVYFDKAKNFIE